MYMYIFILHLPLLWPNKGTYNPIHQSYFSSVLQYSFLHLAFQGILTLSLLHLLLPVITRSSSKLQNTNRVSIACHRNYIDENGTFLMSRKRYIKFDNFIEIEYVICWCNMYLYTGETSTFKYWELLKGQRLN